MLHPSLINSTLTNMMTLWLFAMDSFMQSARSKNSKCIHHQRDQIMMKIFDQLFNHRKIPRVWKTKKHFALFKIDLHFIISLQLAQVYVQILSSLCVKLKIIRCHRARLLPMPKLYRWQSTKSICSHICEQNKFVDKSGQSIEFKINIGQSTKSIYGKFVVIIFLKSDES